MFSDGIKKLNNVRREYSIKFKRSHYLDKNRDNIENNLRKIDSYIRKLKEIELFIKEKNGKFCWKIL